MKEFYITDDRIRLHAKLEMPDGREKCPLVLLFHGFTGDMEEAHIVGVKDAMLESGCAVLRVELYGHGKSEGEFKDHTLFKWFSNAMCVTDYAKTMPFVTDLYISGHSQGGILAMIAAGARPDDYKAVIPLAPALVIPDGARRGEMLGLRFDPNHIPDEVNVWEHTLSGNYFRAAQLIHTEDFIDRYRKPVLIVHGEADDAVPIRYSTEAAARYAECRLVTIPGDDHCYGHHLEKVCEAVKEFLKENEAR